MAMTSDEARAAVDAQQLWYHTIEVAPGVVTPGWFDLRPILEHLPWPDVAGKRCLDVGTWDGHLAFEMERRGAREVVAIDLPDHRDWDWLPRLAAKGTELHEAMVGEKGAGFATAARVLGSAVTLRNLSVYDLDPEEIGTFDVVVMGSLLLHLRDPFRALEAIRGVCTGEFMSCEEIDAPLSALRRRHPLMSVRGRIGHWAVPNVAGHRAMVDISGFDIVRTVKPYAIPFGGAHPQRVRGFKARVRGLSSRIVTGASEGVAHSALLARPALG